MAGDVVQYPHLPSECHFTRTGASCVYFLIVPLGPPCEAGIPTPHSLHLEMLRLKKVLVY